MTYDITDELADVQLDPSRPAVTRLPYAEAALRKAVALAVGAGSVCWSDMTGAGVFRDDHARDIVDGTVAALIDTLGIGKPRLGCATTAELRTELESRLADPVSAAAEYRTVDS